MERSQSEVSRHSPDRYYRGYAPAQRPITHKYCVLKAYQGVGWGATSGDTLCEAQESTAQEGLALVDGW